MLTAEQNLIVAAKKIICMGPKRVVIKKGEDGAMMVTPESIFFCPPFPTESVKDPTGCGDSFAGACMGYLLTKKEWDEKEWRYGCVLGAAAASFCIEEVGVEGLLKISKEDLLKRAEYILQSVCV
jgi:sugar/nucleoside kinase (ribokinase family)